MLSLANVMERVVAEFVQNVQLPRLNEGMDSYFWRRIVSGLSPILGDQEREQRRLLVKQRFRGIELHGHAWGIKSQECKLGYSFVHTYVYV